MAPKTGSGYISGTQISDGKPSIRASWQKASTGYHQRQPEIAKLSETMKGTVKILTTNLWFKTLYRWKIVLTSEYNSDRQPEVSIWPPKPEVVISPEL